MQAWGERSRFVRRETGAEPTKSGVVGLLAAALGYRRTDDLEQLAGLGFGVRVDQPGVIIRDFQTAKSLDGKRVMPLSYRFYLSDAVFLAAVQGDDEWIETLAEALRRPVFPLYLGRRSCPPAEPVLAPDAVRRGTTVFDVLATEPWAASPLHRRRVQNPRPSVSVVLDEHLVPDPGDDRFRDRELPRNLRDLPLSFDPAHRDYAIRAVVRGTVQVVHPERRNDQGSHDPMAELGSA
jgi:CRISPR system Cascade subunit CasD